MFAQRATLARLRLFHDSGRLAHAERIILDAAADPRNDRTDILYLLVPVYSEIGRSDEAERLIEDRWEHLNNAGLATQEQSIKLVRLHIALTWEALSPKNLRLFLDQAGRIAPNDDRVWLGRANLAVQTGALDDARQLLDACQRLRPADVPVAKARLRWALAANRLDDVQQALQRIPAAELTEAQIHHLRAWFYSYRGDIMSPGASKPATHGRFKTSHIS
jgi:thioredoxin-like negative regulator of GroEL